MPLPSEPTTLTGGCFCGAIRYRITVPEASSRPNLPFTPPEAGLTMPYSMTCHCNDCRRASGSVLPLVILQTPSPMLTVSVFDQDDSSLSHTGCIINVLDENFNMKQADSSRPPYQPSMEIFRPLLSGSKSWLRSFHSVDCNPDLHSRSFCGRCGTQVCFHFALKPEYCHDGKLPEGWADLMDINVGTLDRGFLDRGWLEPQSEVNWMHGTVIGKQVAATGKGFRGLVKANGMGEEAGYAEEEELKRLAE